MRVCEGEGGVPLNQTYRISRRAWQPFLLLGYYEALAEMVDALKDIYPITLTWSFRRGCNEQKTFLRHANNLVSRMSSSPIFSPWMQRGKNSSQRRSNSPPHHGGMVTKVVRCGEGLQPLKVLFVSSDTPRVRHFYRPGDSSAVFVGGAVSFEFLFFL